MQSVSWQCPGCNGTFQITVYAVGRRVRCPVCHLFAIADDTSNETQSVRLDQSESEAPAGHLPKSQQPPCHTNPDQGKSN